jgi:hypothetical protein
MAIQTHDCSTFSPELPPTGCKTGRAPARSFWRVNRSFEASRIEVEVSSPRSFQGRRSLGDSQPKRLGFTNDLGGHFHIGFGRRHRSDAQQFFVAGNQVAFFVQIPNDQLSGLVHRRAHGNRAQLPEQVVAQVPRLGQEVLERRLLDLFHFSRTAIAGIQIILEERAKIDLFERILLFIRDGSQDLFGCRLGGERSRSSSWRPTSSSSGMESSNSSSTGFSTISALIMSLSSSLLSASTDTICTRPGVRI